MRIGIGILLAGGLIGASLLGMSRDAYADDSKDSGTDTKYYWQGTQLDNLSRLSNTNPDFEEQQRRARLGKDSDQYLAAIRAQMASQAAANAKEKASLEFNGLLPGSPLEVIDTPDGTQVTLHADMLFYENSASLKAGTADILARLYGLLHREGQKPVHFMIADRIDEGPRAGDIDAERSLVIVAALEFADGEKGIFADEN